LRVFCCSSTGACRCSWHHAATAVRLLRSRLRIVRTCTVNFPLRLRAQMCVNPRKSKAGFLLSLLLRAFLRVTPKFHEPRLLRVKCQTVFCETLRYDILHLLCVFPVVEAEYGSSRPGESHPHALTDPDMNVSAHPALTVQSVPDAAAANEQRALDRARQPRVSNARLVGDAFSGVCISPSPSAQGAGQDGGAWDKWRTCSNDRST